MEVMRLMWLPLHVSRVVTQSTCFAPRASEIMKQRMNESGARNVHSSFGFCLALLFLADPVELPFLDGSVVARSVHVLVREHDGIDLVLVAHVDRCTFSGLHQCQIQHAHARTSVAHGNRARTASDHRLTLQSDDEVNNEPM